MYYVSDLRELSSSSWKSIELLPLVKDLLRNALDPTRKETERQKQVKEEPTKKKKKDDDKKYEKDKQKKKEKKEKKKAKKEQKKLSKSLGEPVNTDQHFKNSKGETMFTEGVVLSEDPETIRNTIQNISIESEKEDMKLEEEHHGERKKSVSFSEDDPITLPSTTKAVEETSSSSSDSSSSSSSISSSSSSDSDECNPTTTTTPTKQQPKVFTGRPIKPVTANRIRVKTSDGSIYETDRYCPHKKVDLATWGQVLGNQLICTKHNWNFNLEGGFSAKGRNINPCKVNDW